MALALAICRSYAYKGTLADFIKKRKCRRLRVLEVHGAGDLTQFLSKLPRYTLARRPDLKIEFLPYRDCSFDLIVHSDVIQYQPFPSSALYHCHRVLSPGGCCVFTVPMDLDRLTRHPESPSTWPEERGETEYGCDAWKDVFCGNFDDVRMITPEFPSAVAFVGVRWAERPKSTYLPPLDPTDDY